MDPMPLGLDELVERWTVLEDDQKLIAGEAGAEAAGFALLLKFFTQYGRFPEGRSELPDEAVEWVARQVKVPASDLGFYEWSNSSTLKYHRTQIRRHFGFRDCSVVDQEKLTDRPGWLRPVRRHRADPEQHELEYLERAGHLVLGPGCVVERPFAQPGPDDHHYGHAAVYLLPAPDTDRRRGSSTTR